MTGHVSVPLWLFVQMCQSLQCYITLQYGPPLCYTNFIVHTSSDSVRYTVVDSFLNLKINLYSSFQYTVEIHVPKKQHGMLLGKHASKIKQLEQSTNTRINVPKPDDTSDVIRISGNKEGVDTAKQHILSFSEDLVCSYCCVVYIFAFLFLV